MKSRDALTCRYSTPRLIETKTELIGMSRSLSQITDDRHDRANEAIDHIARGLKILAGLWLETQDQGGELGTVETIMPIATPAIIEATRPEKTELDVTDLATRWGVSERSIYQWTYTHGLPFKRVGRLKRFDLIEAEAWAKRHREAFGKAKLRVVK